MDHYEREAFVLFLLFVVGGGFVAVVGLIDELCQPKFGQSRRRDKGGKE